MNILGIERQERGFENSILCRKEEINMDFFGVNRIDG